MIEEDKFTIKVEQDNGSYYYGRYRRHGDAFQGAGKGYFTDSINDMIDEGKRENAYCIIRCRDGLNSIEWAKYELQMPQEILNIMLTYIAGDRTLAAIKKYRSMNTE